MTEPGTKPGVRSVSGGGITVTSVPPGRVDLDEEKPRAVLNVLPAGMPRPDEARANGEAVSLAREPDAFNLHPGGTSLKLRGVNTGTKLLVDLGEDGMAGRLGKDVRDDGWQDGAVRSGVDPAIGLLARLAITHLGQEDTNPLYLEGLATAMVARVASVDDASLLDGGARVTDRRVQRALEFIEASLTQRLSLREIAGIAALSPSRFSRVFRNATGTTVSAYVSERRVERATGLLLETDWTTAGIAEAVGFADASHMTRTFRRRRGYTPSEVRET